MVRTREIVRIEGDADTSLLIDQDGYRVNWIRNRRGEDVTDSIIYMHYNLDTGAVITAKTREVEESGG